MRVIDLAVPGLIISAGITTSAHLWAQSQAAGELAAGELAAGELAAGELAAGAPSAADAEPSAAAPPAAAKPAPPPYSLPWQLRPVAPATVLRADTSVAFYENPTTEESGTAVVTTLLGSYKVGEHFAPLVRVGFVGNAAPTPPAAPGNGNALLNPVLGAIAGHKFGPLRASAFLGVALPLGTGGGNEPDKGAREALRVGALTRSAMDNAMFAVNYLTIFPGIDIAYVAHGFTLQGEATVLELVRARGDKVDADETRTNLTLGLHAGYFVLKSLSLGAELRHQRWLSTPTPIRVPGQRDMLRDNSTLSIGPRVHIPLGPQRWVRPGVAVSVPLDDPMADAKFRIVQLDVPFQF